MTSKPTAKIGTTKPLGTGSSENLKGEYFARQRK
jgi:hypothetical protein